MRRGLSLWSIRAEDKKRRDRAAHARYMQKWRTLKCAECGKKGTKLCRDCHMMQIVEKLSRRRSLSAYAIPSMACGSVECRRDWIELNSGWAV